MESGMALGYPMRCRLCCGFFSDVGTKGIFQEFCYSGSDLPASLHTFCCCNLFQLSNSCEQLQKTGMSHL